MPQLQFRRCYVEAIREGRKTQTLRAQLGGGFRVGARLILLNGYRPGARVGDAVVESVDEVPVAALTEEDARRDGFDSLAALLSTLRSTYPTAERFWRVRFWRVRWREFTASIPAR